MITPELIRALGTGLSPARAAEIAQGLDAAAREAGITTPERVAAFVAQLAHESCGFKYAEELWGPTPAQRRYEGRRDLGNTQSGDGHRYRGRGWIQLTGRHNYRKFGERLGLDLENNPDLAARPDIAARLAAAYWHDRGLNAYADAGNFREITRRINGGYNGLQDRLARWVQAKLLLRPAPGHFILIGGGGEEQAAKPGDIYGGVKVDAALRSALDKTYPSPGGPWEHQGLRVWRRRNGDIVLERYLPATPVGG